MTKPGQQALTPALLRTLMEESAAVPLHAVREMQHEFIQAQAAMTQQSLAVQQQALRQQEESLRVQLTILAQLASAADSNSAPETPRERSAVPRIHWADGSFHAMASGMPNTQGAA